MPDKQKIIVVGATGQIGSALCERILRDSTYDLVIFSRTPEKARESIPGAADYVAWQPEETGAWAVKLDGAYGVVNLAGAPAFGVRWTKQYRQMLRENRITIARGLVRAMQSATVRPHVFIQASSVGAYGYTSMQNSDFNEETPPDADSYSEESLATEKEAMSAESLGVRTVVLRAGFVLSKKAGGFPSMSRSVSRGWGGILSPGTQWLPWIHIEDEVDIILSALTDERLRGPLNATAPQVPTQRQFMQTLGKAVGRRVWMVIPAALLRLFMGDAAAILTRGKRIVPARLLAESFQFHYPTLDRAFEDLLSKQ
jgi:uncharacterized protein (TIGR01777 family)